MKYFAWLLAIVFFVSCNKEGSPVENYSALTMLDVAYGDDVKQKMDVYLPANRSADSTKLLVLIHGGGWAEGDKADFTAMVPMLQQRLPNYAFCNINYRLAVNGANLFPIQETDVKAAIEFIYAKRADYKLSDKFAYAGASAGGHLALLQGYKYSTPVKPKAVVSFFGPADLTSLFQSNIPAAVVLLQATGTTPDLNPSIYQQSSPTSFANAQSPSTMLLHGGTDPLVPASQAQLLQNLLNTLGVHNEYVLYPNEGHGWTGSNFDDSLDKIAAFLKAYVR